MNKDITIEQDANLLGIGIIELPKNCVVVISDGKAKVRELPEHGEYRIVTHAGKIKRMRREEGGRVLIVEIPSEKKPKLKTKLNEIKDFIVGKSHRNARNYLISFVVTFVLLKMDFLTQRIFNFSVDLGSLYLGILFFIFCILGTAFATATLNFISEKTDANIYKKEQEYKKDLFNWLGEDFVSEIFIYKLFESEANKDFDDIKNLISIKTKLEEALEKDVVNYYLLKNHLEFKQKNNSMKKLKALIFTLIGTGFTALVSPLIQNMFNIEKHISKNLDLTFWMNLFTKTEYYGAIFVYLGIGAIVYFMVLSTYSNLTERSRRNSYLISILEILIEEKRTEK